MALLFLVCLLLCEPAVADGTVLKMQPALRELGLYHGPDDGILSGELRKAIETFQEGMGLPVTREPDSATMDMLTKMDRSAACWNYLAVMRAAGYPREAARQGLGSGSVVVEFTIEADGRVDDVHALKASHEIFADAAVRLVSRYKCKARDQAVRVTVPFEYRLQ